MASVRAHDPALAARRTFLAEREGIVRRMDLFVSADTGPIRIQGAMDAVGRISSPFPVSYKETRRIEFNKF